MRSAIRSALHILLLAAAWPAQADSEAANRPHVTAGPHGQCYVRSVPAEYWGQAGVTRLFRVAADEDDPVATFDWFAQRIFLNCNAAGEGTRGVSLVRLGPWARGRRASADDLALALYFDGRLLARYSTLDIAGDADNVEASVSHYVVIRKVEGFRNSEDGAALLFVVETVDGRVMEFDTATGARRKSR